MGVLVRLDGVWYPHEKSKQKSKDRGSYIPLHGIASMSCTGSTPQRKQSKAIVANRTVIPIRNGVTYFMSHFPFLSMYILRCVPPLFYVGRYIPPCVHSGLLDKLFGH